MKNQRLDNKKASANQQSKYWKVISESQQQKINGGLGWPYRGGGGGCAG